MTRTGATACENATLESAVEELELSIDFPAFDVVVPADDVRATIYSRALSTTETFECFVQLRTMGGEPRRVRHPAINLSVLPIFQAAGRTGFWIPRDQNEGSIYCTVHDERRGYLDRARPIRFIDLAKSGLTYQSSVRAVSCRD